MDIQIDPVTLSFSIVKLTYEITYLIPNVCCYINAYLTEANGNRIKRYELVLAGDEYSQWGQDDTFLTNWICVQCGVKKPEPPPVIVETVEPVVVVVSETPVVEEPVVSETPVVVDEPPVVVEEPPVVM